MSKDSSSSGDKSANWNHQFVDKAINSALKEMIKMEKSLSSEAK